jgi:AcrR family transcriptional regulator
MEATGTTNPRTDTRDLLLDTAERLFAEHGIDATSLRTITSEAAANLAAVHYHFGSKDGLIQEVFARRFDPLNEDRLQRLIAREQEHGERPVPVNEIVEAFIAPALKRLRQPESRHFMKLMGRVFGDPGKMHDFIQYRFHDIARRFIEALAKALPELEHNEVLRRFKFMLGVMFIVLMDPMSQENLPDNLASSHCDLVSDETPLSSVVSFLSAGMKSGTDAGLQVGTHKS